jgi:serine/threonine-protein kinase HipA
MRNPCLYCYQELEHGEKEFHARCSKAFFGTPEPPALGYSLDQMGELARQVVERSVTVPGVQPKLFLSLVKDTLAAGRDSRLTVVGALGGNYILKPPNPDYPEMPANEHLTMRMAEAFGLRVVPSSLIRLSSGELSYITKRIDRTSDGVKIHMLDMFQVLEAVDKYKSSMERVGKAIAQYIENTLLELIYFFELTIFNFLTGNNDMHLKNFSMLLQPDGTWDMAPAYDLLNVSIVNPKDKEELALPIDGRKSKLNRARFEAFGKGLGLTGRQINGAFNRLNKNVGLAREMISKSLLTEKMQEEYELLLSARYARLGLAGWTAAV